MKIKLTQKQLISLSRDCGLHFNPITSKKQFIQLFHQIENNTNNYSFKVEIVNFYNKVKQTQRDNQLSKLFS